MKKLVLIAAVLMNVIIAVAQVDPPAPPAPPEAPVLKVEGDKVTITTANGDIWVIDNNMVSKNGTVIVSNSEDMEDEIEDIQDEIEDIREESANLTPGSEEYEDLQDALNDLQDALYDLGGYSYEYNYKMDTLPGDSTSVVVGNWRLIVKEDGDDDVDVSFGKVPDVEEVDDHYVDVYDTEWFLFDLGYNTYLNADHEVQVEAPYNAMEDLKAFGSWDVNLHLFRSRVNIAKGYLNFNYGLSFEWHNFRYNESFVILPKMDSVTLEFENGEAEAYDFKKNRFSTTHFTLPVIIGFETKPWDTDKSFRMGFGYSPGIMLKGKTKIESDNGTDKVKDDFNLAPFRHELNYMIGYGDFNIYASYDVNGMFREGEGPELHPFSVGLIIRQGF